MNNLRQSRVLAHEIGLCRIAMVVDKFCREMETRTVLREHFGTGGDWGSYRARLTHFWWVALGGKGLRTVSFDMFPIEAELSGDWIILFRQAALSIVGKELTEAWMREVEQLGRRLRIANEESLVELTKAS
jgi:hemoglobin